MLHYSLSFHLHCFRNSLVLQVRVVCSVVWSFTLVLTCEENSLMMTKQIGIGVCFIRDQLRSDASIEVSLVLF